MKAIRCMVFAALACFALQTVQAQVANADTMVHRIFSIVQAKDKDAFVALFPSDAQMLKIMKKVAAVLKDEISKKAKETGAAKDSLPIDLDSLVLVSVEQMTTPAGIAEMKKGLGERFTKFLEKGEKKGVNWQKAKLIDYTIDSTLQPDEQTRRILEDDRQRRMKGVIRFAVGDSAYQLLFSEVLFMPQEGGWFGAELKKVIRSGEDLNENEEEVDVTVTGVEEEEVPPPPKKKANAKGKTSGTKSSMRKPHTKS